MENRDLARLLRETADLMEVAAEDGFRIRTYRRAADTIDSQTTPVAALGPRQLRELPGIGKKLSEQIVEAVATGRLEIHQELLRRFRPEMLQLLQVPGMGPKTVALIWNTFGAGSLDAVEELARTRKLRTLSRFSAAKEEKTLRGITAMRSLAGYFRRDQADELAELLVPRLLAAPGVASVTVAGSYRRGCDNVADVAMLACGEDFPASGDASALIATFCALPRMVSVLAREHDRASIRVHGGLRVDLRLASTAGEGAALLYLTGSPKHLAHLRRLAQNQGCSLAPEGLVSLTEPGSVPVAASEEDIYSALGLAWIAPELREDEGEIEAAAAGPLPPLVEEADIRGDVHMHTVATDGRATIAEMATAAAARGYGYIAITDHSQALAMANGLNEERMLRHLEHIRAAEADFQREHPGFRIFAGVEVDILADGRLDLQDDVLARLDLVIGSVHSRFDQPAEETTERLLRAVANPHLDLLGHPTGRLLLRREPYSYNFDRVLAACAREGVAMEINASPERLDLNSVYARRCQERGIGIVINTDAHAPRHLANLRHGIAVARRAGLGPQAVWNTRSADAFQAGLRRRRSHT